MSHLQYYSYEGVGQTNLQTYRYNQAVRIGDRIECAGQGILTLLSAALTLRIISLTERLPSRWLGPQDWRLLQRDQ